MVTIKRKEDLGFLAAHEIGHVMVALKLGLQVESVTLRSKDNEFPCTKLRQCIFDSGLAAYQIVAFFIAGDLAYNFWWQNFCSKEAQLAIYQECKKYQAVSDWKQVEDYLHHKRYSLIRRKLIIYQAKKLVNGILIADNARVFHSLVVNLLQYWRLKEEDLLYLLE